MILTLCRARQFIVCVAVIAAFLGGAHRGFAGLLRVESESLFFGRNGTDFKAEAPMYEFLSSSYVSNPHDFEFNTNFSVFGDPAKSKSQFDLYIFDLAYSPVQDVLTFRAGRSFNVHTSTRTTTTDSLGADLALFDKRIKLGTMAGVERKLLNASLDSTTQFVSNNIQYRSSSQYPLFLKAKYQYRNMPNLPGQHLVGGAVQKPFGSFWSPEFLLNSEVNAQTFVLNIGEGGFDLYPTTRMSVRWRAMTYESKPDDDVQDPLFSIFSLGRLYETSLQLDYQFNSVFSSSVAFAYDDYLLQAALRTYGYRAEWGSRFHKRFLTATNTAYYFFSYGGKAYGDRIKFREDLTDKLEFTQGVDVSYYEKVTSAQRLALNVEGWIGYSFTDRLKFNVGGEFNSNNSLRYDARGIAKLTYLLWKEI
ncbi:hypothetical protein WDW86_14740 [Bdellovibrionota bacterium FG-2]